MKEYLYKRIARELAQKILTGTYPPGSLIPPEMELCETWKVSRHTMREALRELTEQGLISRHKGAGTRVCEPHKSGVSHPLSHFEDLVMLARHNRRVIKKIDEIVADIELSKLIECPPGSRWLHIASIREDARDPEAPICCTDSYVSTDYSRLRKFIRDDPQPLISDLIEEHYGIKCHEVHQTITAVGVPRKIARILNVEPGSPALRIVRRYRDHDGRVFETTISLHPEGRYTCSIVLKSQAPGE